MQENSSHFQGREVAAHFVVTAIKDLLRQNSFLDNKIVLYLLDKHQN